MKLFYPVAVLGLAALLAGCTTTSKVQEMIDASHQDYADKVNAHENSIVVLKKSAVTGLEKTKENAELLAEQQKQLDQLAQQIKIVQGHADAAKVMSAANTVKVANLEEAMNANKDVVDKTLLRMTAIDKLYEEVLIRHYKVIADSANASMAALKADGMTATTNAPVKLDRPIEIVAPDTSANATNGMVE